MRLIVGLGNPGSRYAYTRHNIGFLVLDQLASGSAAWQRAEDACAEVASVSLAGEQVLLVKPQTFMNRSGDSLVALADRMDFTAEQILVLLDDFTLDFGRLRVRRGGSDGGHNGLASVLEAMQTNDVPRLRLGIGKPPADQEIIDFVLSPFADTDPVNGLAERGVQAVECYLQEGVEAAMNHFNGVQAL